MTSIARGAPVPATTIHAEVLSAARRYPDRVAVRCGPAAVTYARLESDARQVALALTRRGVRPGDLIPVMARRGRDLPAVLLGVLMTGAGYGMLDVRWPQARLAELAGAMQPPFVLADKAGTAVLGGMRLTCVPFEDVLAGSGGTKREPLPEVAPSAVSTMFWTSGSTGRPKGVLSTHQATTRLFTERPCVPFGDASVMANAAAVPWDAFTLELWSMLMRGGTLIVHEDDLLLPNSIRAYIGDHGMTHLFMTPSLFDVVVQADLDCLAGLRVLVLGGDKPSPASCARFLDAFPGAELYNGYGPVESCVFASVRRIRDADLHGDGVPIGEPVANTGLYVVRDALPVPYGELGEIAITGAGLARGYHGDRERTEEAFRTVHVDGCDLRAYHTGDRGWMDAEGVLHFAGREDNQFKIAGHRIEAGEIESAACAAGCAQALVLPLREDGTDRVVLFAVPADPAGAEALGGEQGLRDRLAARLPAYLVPARVHLVREFPLLENTKIDKLRLAASFGYPPPGRPVAAAAGEKR